MNPITLERMLQIHLAHRHTKCAYAATVRLLIRATIKALRTARTQAT